MIFGLVTKSNNGTSFGAWQAISFSHSHAFRDMLGVVLNTGVLYDMFSLVASTPFDDTSSNVDGLNDLILMGSTGLISQTIVKNYYETRFYRFYETTSSGD